MFLDEISQIYIAYTTHKVVYKFHGSIYKRENAINIEVQPKVLLNVFLGVLLKARFARAIILARGAPSPLFSLVHNYKYYFMRISDIFFNQRCSCLSTRFIFLRLFIFLSAIWIFLLLNTVIILFYIILKKPFTIKTFWEDWKKCMHNN